MKKALWMAAMLAMLSPCALAQPAPEKIKVAEKIIIDTDIGDDIDDAFALALALNSPEFDILGVSAAFGDTTTRARLLDRFLGEAGRRDIPVAAGKPAAVNLQAFTQRRWAEDNKFARPPHPDSVDFILGQIRKYPGQITLVAIGPLPNIGAMIDKDPDTFRKLKRVVIMGGSINSLTDPFNIAAPIAPHVEWNIKNDVVSAQKLFAAGVPLQVLPLDSTANLKMHDVARDALFRHGSVLTDILMVLYEQWSFRLPEASFAYTRKAIPTLYDPMTLASMLDPSLCPLTPMHIQVGDDGMTRPVPGVPNAEVCLKSDENAFLRFYVKRLTAK
jgi:inosine-uridine nucleoside N-ribohydrolase